MKIIYLDTETTGVDYRKNGIIQLSAIIERDDNPDLHFLNTKMSPFPDDIIEDSALVVNKVTRDQLDDFLKPESAYRDFTNLLSLHVDKFDRLDKFVMIGYNVGFDADFLRAWFQKNGDKYYGSWFWFPYIDVMTLAMAALAQRRPAMDNFKLPTVAQQFGIEVKGGELHDALYDVRLTREIYKRLTVSGRQS